MLITCPECELPISDKALSCPHCGYPMTQTAVTRKSRNKNNKRRRLPNGFGQISEIKNKNLRNPFRAMVSVGKTDEGRPICKPLKPDSYFPTYNDAYTALVEYNKNPYDLGESMTVRELYEKWSEQHFKTLSARSSVVSLQTAWAYCSQIYNMRVLDVRGRHIKACMEEGTATFKNVTRKPTYATKGVIKSLFNLMLDYALEYELVDQNYARSFRQSSVSKKDTSAKQKGHIPFTDEEMNLLWANVSDKTGIDLILIQCYSGWRPQELGLIKHEDVDFDQWLFTGGMKTTAGVERVVPIHTKIRPFVLQRYEEAKTLDSPYLFNYVNSNRLNANPHLSYARLYHQFKKIVDDLKLNPDHKPHDGRKHFVTIAKKYKVDEYAIKHIVGHAITDLTERIYTERESDWLHSEIKKIK